jgi:hypothetical protein
VTGLTESEINTLTTGFSSTNLSHDWALSNFNRYND